MNTIRFVPIRKIFPVIAIFLSLLSVNWTWLSSESKRDRPGGIDESGKKIYAGTAQIESTRPYQQFKLGTRSEAEKLRYLSGRLCELGECKFRFIGNYYGMEETRFGIDWLIAHRYKKDEDVRSFLREQVAQFESMGNPLAIKFPDGKIYLALPIVMNELDLLESTIEKEKHFRMPSYDSGKPVLFENNNPSDNAYLASNPV